MIQQTSLKAYLENIKSLGRKQKQVYHTLLRMKFATNMELAQYLGWSINRVTPRVKELREQGLVEVSDKRPCKITGRTAIEWRVKK
jgi:Mn-dependent DtxR family transcriptional regulator